MEAEAKPSPTNAWVPVDDIHESKTNPRHHYDEEKLLELASTIEKHGILEPLIVRPHATKDDHFELVAGSRRLRAAKKAGLAEVPVSIRNLSDADVLEIQLIENLQRDDIDALSEAEGYQRLIKIGKYDTAGIARRIGKSIEYVYSRLKLMELTAEGKKLLADGEISVGHAIILARLAPELQKAAIKSDMYGSGETPGLFVPEDLPHLPGMKRNGPDRKAVTVREFQAWVDENVRLDPKAPEAAETFPEMGAAIAEEPPEKVVSIRLGQSYGSDADQDKKDGVLDATKYKLATGKRGERTCEQSELGVVVIAAGRGQTMRICRDRSCKIHWKKEPKMKSSSRGSSAAQEARQKRENEKWEQKRRAEELARQRWAKVVPVAIDAIAAKLKESKALPAIAKFIVGQITVVGENRKKLFTAMPPGRTAESLVRFVAFSQILRFTDSYYRTTLEGAAKSLGVDVAAILKAQAKPAPAAKAEKPSKKGSGKPKAKSAAKKQGKKK